MGIVYLAALITALGILGIQFFMPGEAGEDANSDVSHAESDGTHGALPLVLSLRFWTFTLLAFGLVGAALWSLRLSGSITTFVLAAGMGLGSGALASLTFRALSRGQISSGGEIGDVVGKVGRVLIAPSGARCGKVRIEVRGQIHDYLAKAADEMLEPGTFVVVDDVRDGVAHVSRAPDDLAPRRVTKAP